MFLDPNIPVQIIDGLKAYLARKGKKDVNIDGLNGEQRFYLAFARRWRKLQTETALRQQLKSMSETSTLLNTQTTQLVTALRAPQTRGRWGEMQLERVVEPAAPDLSDCLCPGPGPLKARPERLVHE